MGTENQNNYTEKESKEVEEPKKRRGFATLSPERRKEIASMGGVEAHARGTAHKFKPGADETTNAGRKGGISISRDLEHMAEIGRRGGNARGKSPS